MITLLRLIYHEMYWVEYGVADWFCWTIDMFLAIVVAILLRG